jgi:hypothetical protein
MKKILILSMLIISTITYSQNSSSKSLLKWKMGNLDLVEFTRDSSKTYILYFRNAKYQNIVDIKYTNFGDINDLKENISQLDSIVTNIELENSEIKSYNVNGIKVFLSKSMGVKSLSLYSDDELGNCYLVHKDFDKMREAILQIK